MEKTKLDYFFVFFFLMIAAKTSFIYEYDVFWFIFSASCFSYGLYTQRIYGSDLYRFTIFTAIFLLYIILRNVLFNKLEIIFLISDVFFLLKYILIAYIFCIIFKKNATVLISEVVIFLAKVSLVLYIFQLVGGGNILFKIGETFHNNTLPYSGISATYSNFLIFTYDKLHNIRNSGFVWEPGAFGCFLVIALLFHFMNNYFVIDRNAIILIIATITTISTTAYLALAVLMVLYYRFNDGKISWKMILLSVFGLVLFFNLPFLGDKITNIYEEDVKILEDYEEITNQLAYYDEYGGEVKLNRFSSVIFLYRNFGYQLILGVSNAYINLNSKIFGVGISRFNISNGTIDFIAKFGLVGFAFLLFRMGKFIYLHYQKLEYSLYTVVMILVMNFGEPLLILPITLIFLFLPRFSLIDYDFEEENDEIRTEEIHKLTKVN